MHRVAVVSLALAGALATGSAASAQDLEVRLTPYLWMAGIKGDVGAVVDRPPTPVDADFPGVFDKLAGAFMGKAEIRYGRFGAFGNLDYLSLEGDKNVRVNRLLALGGEIETSVTEGTLAGYWRAVDGGNYNVDILAGGRYTKVEVDASVSLNNRSISGSADRDWWDGVIGVKGSAALTDRWSLSGYGDVGGGGSDGTWQVWGTVNYQFTDSIVGSAGYRYYSVDFEEDDFKYGVDVAGPLLGVTFIF